MAGRGERAWSLQRIFVEDELGRREAWAIAAVLGMATCLLAFGLDFILGRGPHWAFPGGDLQAQLVGYRYFVSDSWHFPLLKTAMIGPKGVNIVVLDSIPLVALAGKLLRGIVGETFNPYGWWMLAIYVLQARFAMRLTGALGVRTRLPALAAAVFALTSHVFILRFYHQALDAHFVLLWALCLYFERPCAASPWRSSRSAGRSCSACALLVHPYLFAMAFAIFAAACVHGVRFDRALLRTPRAGGAHRRCIDRGGRGGDGPSLACRCCETRRVVASGSTRSIWVACSCRTQTARCCGPTPPTSTST